MFYNVPIKATSNESHKQLPGLTAYHTSSHSTSQSSESQTACIGHQGMDQSLTFSTESEIT